MRTIPLLAEAYSEARLDLSKLDRDIKRVETKLTQAAKRMEKKLKLRVDIDTRVAEQKLRNFERNVDRTRRRLNARGINLDVDVEANTTSAAEAGRAAREAAETAFGDRPATITVDLNDRRFRAAYRRVQALLRRLTARRYNINVDIDYDEDAFSRLQDTIVNANEARRLRIDVEFDVDLESARAEVRRAREEVALLAKEQSAAASTVSIKVELDGASAVLSELAAIQTALAALPRQVTVDVDTRGGVDDAVTTAVTEATQATEGLAETAADAGASIADTLQALDAAQGILGRALPQTVKDQGVEALRAVNASAQQAVRDAISKTQEAFKGVKEKVTTRIETKGGLETLRTVAEVEAAIAAVPGEVDIRFRADARDFFADSFTDVLVAKAEELAATQRFADERLNRERLAQQLADQDELGKALIESAKKAEEEATKLSRQAVAERGDVEKAAALNAKADELRAKAVLERQAAEESQRLSRETAAKLEESSKVLRRLRRDAVTEQSQLFTTKGFEALARRIAQLAPANRPTDGDLVDIDAIRRQVDGVKRALDSVVFDGNLSPEVTLETAQFYAAIAAVEAELAKIDGSTADPSVDLDGLSAATAELLTYESLLERVDGDDITNRVEVKGLSKALAGLAALAAGRRAAGGDVDINVDVNRVGRISRTIGGIARLAGGAVSAIGRGLNRVQGFLGALGNVFDDLGDRVQSAFSKITENLGDIAGFTGKITGAISAAAGPIGSAVAAIAAAVVGPGLITLIVGGITALAGPVVQALGSLIGAAIAFLGSSVIAGAAAGGLPIAAIFLGPAKDEIGKLLEPLKEQLITAFEPTTDLIVNSILPAFTQLASEIIPIAASVADSFIEPIAESLYALAANPALADAIVRLTEPMANGIASIIDTFTQYVPLFTDIALTVGPPITAAVNSILSAVFALGAVFQDDVGNAFQVIADLFDRITPTLASLGPALTPIINLLAQLIVVLVDAAAGLEERVGPLGGFIDEISAALPDAIPGLIALGEGFIAILDVMPELIRAFNVFAGVVTATLAVTAGGVYLSLKAFGLVAKAITGVLDALLAAIARTADGAATVLEWLPGVGDGVAESLRMAADDIDGVRESVRNAGNAVFDSGDAFYELANGFGNATDAAFGFEDTMGGVADANQRGADTIAELEAKARVGAITMVEFADATGASATSGVRTLGEAVDGLTKRLEDGSFALGNFTAEALELPTAADYVTEVADPRQAARDRRDQARRMRDLQRQTVRDQQDIARAAQDYQDAIAEAAKARQEAPELYEWGADNFNAVLFADSVKRQEEYDKRIADAERAIQDRARALEDAQLRREDNQIALADALEDQLFGDPSGITEKVIEINSALEQGYADIAKAAERARTLLQIRNLGPDFEPLADWLESLDPDLLQSAIDQLGGIGSAAFAEAARRMNEEVDKSNIGFEQRMSEKRKLIAAESLRIKRLMDLVGFGFEDLAAELGSIEDVEQFNAEFEGIESGIGFAAAEQLADAAKAEQEALAAVAADAKNAGIEYSDTYTENFGKGVTEGLARYTGGVTTADGRRFGSIDAAVANSTTGAAPEEGTPAETAYDAGGEVAVEWARGFDDAWESEAVQRIGSLVDELFGNADFEAFAVAGQDSAEKFYDGLSSAFRNDVNKTFALAPLGAILISLRLRTSEYEEVGNAWGGAVIAGIGNGANEDAGTLSTVFDLLADSIATDSIADQWVEAGEVLGRAVMDGIRDGISGSREFLSARLGAVRLGVTLQDDLWAEAGDALGAAVVAGIADGLEADWQTVLTALELYADDAARQLRPWTTAGEALGEALALGVASGLLVSRQVLTTAVSVVLGDPALPQAAVTQGESIGRALTAGVQRGLLLGLPVMLATATVIADSIGQVMRARLGINSPSKVTETIGGQIVDGLVAGIEKGRADAVGSAVSVAEDMAAAFTKPDYKIELPDTNPRPGPFRGRPLASGQGTIQTTLDDEWFRLIDSALFGPGATDWFKNSKVYLPTPVGGFRQLPSGYRPGDDLSAGVRSAADRAADRSVTTNSERTVVEETTINVYGVQDGPAAANEIARRQRDRKFLRGRQ